MNYNVLPLRDVVIYPGVVTPLFVGRAKSIKAIEAASHSDMKIVLVTQKSAEVENPTAKDLYNIGTLANIVQMMILPDGTVKLLVEGADRVMINSFLNDDLTQCEANILVEDMVYSETEFSSLRKTLLATFESYIRTQRKQPKELVETVTDIADVSRLLDAIASHLQIKIQQKIDILQEVDLERRVILLMTILETELDVLDLEKSIRSRVKQQMDKNQKEYYLNEQAKAIQKELEELDGDKNELGLLETAIKKAKMPLSVEEKCLAEVEKLRKMSPMSSEATVLRNYLDVMIAYPWAKVTALHLDLMKAKLLLEDSHYGLEEVKKRIIEYIAVQQRNKKPTGSILCLVGPPGVGKTSIGKSIAKAVNREYIRMSLGGVRDEAEIRGHRRTYIGAMPGRIIQNITKSKVSNPFFLLDEIDKMGMDHRGDPASAMLEVLDPEQNHTFNDHYMEVDIDLSNVMFMATANSLDMPAPLLDRMEIIRIPGYTENEKTTIAKKYLVPRTLKRAGLKPSEINITDKALALITSDYTREAGVRNLEREIAKICRKVVTEISLGEASKVSISLNNLSRYLGVAKYSHDGIASKDHIGRISGLAWTSVGGELLNIEVAILPGKGRVVETGKLGEVMKESIHAAMTVIKKYTGRLGVSSKFFQEHDFHIHLPEAAVPKDGPSAGVALSTALLSAVMHEPISGKIAMTGEVTLQGNVLPIGGLKEKLFAAVREGVETVFIPKDNEKNLDDVSDEIKNKLNICVISQVEEIFAIVFDNRLNIKKNNESSLPFVNNYLAIDNESEVKH